MGMFDGIASPSSGNASPAAGFDLALGGSLTRKLVVYGEVFAFDNVAIMHAHYAATGLGPGLAVWLPHDAYISASVTRLWMSQSKWIPNSTGSSDRDWDAFGKGYGASFAIGKEWGTKREDVTAGLALQGFVGRLRCASGCSDPDEMRPSAWSTRGAMLAVSATFN
jgi:hypothetical protein